MPENALGAGGWVNSLRNYLKPEPGDTYGNILPLARDGETNALRLSLPMMARDAVNNLAFFADAPRAAYAGEIDPNDRATQERLAQGVFEMGIGTMPFNKVPANALGMFAGKAAKTADLDMAAKAEEMLAAGASRDDVWRETGWFRGADGEMRFEIDDMRSRVKNGTNELSLKKRESLDDSFQHDDLFAAYPELAGMPLRPDYARAGEVNGSFKGRDEGVTLSPFVVRDRDKTRSVLLHELQHGVQDVEGFGRGGNVGTGGQIARDELWSKAFRAQDGVTEAVKALPPEYQQQWQLYLELGGDKKWAMQDRMMKNEVLAPVLELQSQAQRLSEMAGTGVDSDVAFDTYRRLAGEAEARNVQARRDVTPTRRGAPWETQDTPDERQIVRFRGGE